MCLVTAEPAAALTLRQHEPPWQPLAKVRSGLIEMKPLEGAAGKINWFTGRAAWSGDVLVRGYVVCDWVDWGEETEQGGLAVWTGERCRLTWQRRFKGTARYISRGPHRPRQGAAL